MNPYGVNHTPLKRARLPVPPLPHIAHYRAQQIYYTPFFQNVKTFFEKSLRKNEILSKSVLLVVFCVLFYKKQIIFLVKFKNPIDKNASLWYNLIRSDLERLLCGVCL